MAELEHSGVPEVPAVPADAADPAARLAALRAAGAHRFDPAGLHYLEALAARAAAQAGGARQALEAKLDAGLAAFSERFQAARSAAAALLDQCLQQHPHAGAGLQQLFASGDFQTLHREVALLQNRAHCAPLRALVDQLEAHETEALQTQAVPLPAARAELKAVRQFRDTWSRLSIDQHLSQALRHAPKNAGPINSHMLMLRSLELMREVAPGYLNCFMSYADTLLCLDLGEKDKTSTARKAPAAKAKK